MKWFHIISLWLLPLLIGPSAKHILRDHLVQWSHFPEKKTEAQPEDVTGKVPRKAGKSRTLDSVSWVAPPTHCPVTHFLERCCSYFPPRLLRDFLSHYSFTKKSHILRPSGGPMRSSWLSWAESSAPRPKTNRPLILPLPSQQTSLFNVPALCGKKRTNSTWFLSYSKVNLWPIRCVDNWCQLLVSTMSYLTLLLILNVLIDRPFP